MIPVTSSRVSQIGWQPVGETGNAGNCYVTFKDGLTGYYEAVPKDIFEQFRDSPSKGKFLSDYIIKQGYRFVTISGQPGRVTTST